MDCNCEKCIYYKACDFHFYLKEYPPNKCDLFKDKSRFIELPCKVGDTVYIIVNYHCSAEFRHIAECKFIVSLYDSLGKTVFLTKEEAEKALEKLNK